MGGARGDRRTGVPELSDCFSSAAPSWPACWPVLPPGPLTQPRPPPTLATFPLFHDWQAELVPLPPNPFPSHPLQAGPDLPPAPAARGGGPHPAQRHSRAPHQVRRGRRGGGGGDVGLEGEREREASSRSWATTCYLYLLEKAELSLHCRLGWPVRLSALPEVLQFGPAAPAGTSRAVAARRGDYGDGLLCLSAQPASFFVVCLTAVRPALCPTRQGGGWRGCRGAPRPL